jgi:LmbE family N-acetylglucosaminyl deacetylase
MKMKRVMLIEPGPGNGFIGCGASVSKHVRHGREIHVVSATSGDALNDRHSPEVFKKIRHEEAWASAAVLGIPKENIHFLEHMVLGIHINKAAQQIAALVRQYKPELCYIPSEGGSHPDYGATGKASKIALNFSPGLWFSGARWYVPAILVYEVGVPLYRPNYFEEVSLRDMKLKAKAFQAHASQMASKRYDQAAMHLAEYRRIILGQKKPFESFEACRTLKVY